jgi:hypothetical protein
MNNFTYYNDEWNSISPIGVEEDTSPSPPFNSPASPANGGYPNNLNKRKNVQ